jgi:hypothetical protein
MKKVMNQGACEMTADELELVSGGSYLGPAAKAQGAEAQSVLGAIGSALAGAMNLCSVS